MQQALGLIETRELVPAIEAAKVKFLSRQKVKGGLVAIMVAGDVGAVKAAVDAGAAAGKRVGTVVSSHVIPRPHDDIDTMIPGNFEQNAQPEQKKEPQQKSEPKKAKRG
jgi:microcompartment protein CcmL/EutN